MDPSLKNSPGPHTTLAQPAGVRQAGHVPPGQHPEDSGKGSWEYW